MVEYRVLSGSKIISSSGVCSAMLELDEYGCLNFIWIIIDDLFTSTGDSKWGLIIIDFSSIKIYNSLFIWDGILFGASLHSII